MAITLFEGDTVKIASNAPGVATRYTDRFGVVVGTTPRGRGVRYLVAFPGRRATPVEVSAKNLTLAS
jgi:hypothetical protein